MFIGKTCLDSDFEAILNSLFKRFEQGNCQEALKRQLYNTVMCAFSYNAQATFGYMEKNNLTAEFFRQLCGLASTFNNSYERKTFIQGMCHMLNCQVLPPSIQANLLEILKSIIGMLNVIQSTEKSAMKKAAGKEIFCEGDDSDSDDDDDDDDDDEEDDKENEADDEAEPNHTEENKEMNVEEEKETDKKGKELSSDSDEDDDDIDELFDLHITMDLLSSPFKKADEFQNFKTTLQ